MKNELQINSIKVPVVLVDKFKKLGITEDEASSLMQTFGVPLTEAGAILNTYQDIVVTDESQIEIMAEAKAKRLTLKKIRTGVENTRKDLKSEFDRKGNAIQAVANYIKEEIEPAESYLELQEKYIEIKKAEAAAKKHSERIEKLSSVTDDINLYNYDAMTDDQFDKLISDLQLAKDAKLAAEKKAEEERIEAEIAEKKRQADIELENQKLKQEADEREKRQIVITNRINKVTYLGLVFSPITESYSFGSIATMKRSFIEESADKDFDKQLALISDVVNEYIANVKKEEAEAQAKIDAELQKERDAAAEERKKREDLERIESERKAAEAKAEQDAKDAEMSALLSPDKDKLVNFAKGLDIVRKEKLPAVKTKQAQDIINNVELKLSQLFNYINDEANKL
jgi:hypothetical protein